MTSRSQSGLMLLLLAAAPYVAGCGESHAPAATSTAAGSDARAAVIAPTTAKPAQQPREPAPDPAKAPAPAAPASRLPRSTAGGTLDITFDTIKFQMEKTEPFRPEMLTPDIRALDGRRIRIRGYILPSFQQSGITQFVLVRDNMQCCFGPGAALYDCILVEMSPGKSTDYKVQPVAVEGTFALSDLKDPDGKHLAIFHLTGESVR